MALDMFGVNALPAGTPVTKTPASGVTGPWIDVRSTVGKVYPYRITAYGGFSADVVYIERIDGDNSVAANVIQVAQLGSNQEVVVDAPTDWIRARTGASLSGTAQVLLAQTA